jgi:uncharacterized protein (DUF2249 family)
MAMSDDDLTLLDVRDDLRAGREPLARILAAVDALPPGRGLRLYATFEPIPLYRVLARRGFAHEARRLGGGDWEILFRPEEGTRGAPQDGRARADADDSDWPPPATHLDNRGLAPPEPMMRILQTLEDLAPGEVLAAINDREPMFLLPELEARGHRIRIQRRDDGVYLTIRRGGDGA